MSLEKFGEKLEKIGGMYSIRRENRAHEGSSKQTHTEQYEEEREGGKVRGICDRDRDRDINVGK